MKKRVKWYIIERIKRINFIKTELTRLVGKSIFKNAYNTNYSSIFAYRYIYYVNINYNTISNFRLYCPLNLSPKLANKKYRLSRFSLNSLAKQAKIPGFLKKGW